MALTSYGYDGTVLEGGWAKLSRYLGRAAAIGGTNDFAPTIVGGVDRTVRVGTGSLYKSGVLVVSDATADLQSGTVASGSRYDTLVLRRDWQTNTSSLVIIAGSATRAVTLTNSNPGTIEDQAIALIKITAGQQTPAEVIDLRPPFSDDQSEIGTEKFWGTTTPPAGYLVEDGSAVDRIKYATLFARYGTTYGAGDGSTTFNLPNARGRTLVAFDATQAEFDTMGEVGGSKTVILATGELPAHAHGLNGHNHGGPTSTASLNHSHTIGHNHGRSYGSTYGGAGNHAHGIAMSDFGGLGGGGTLVRLGYNGSFPTGSGGAGAHDHSAYVDVPDVGGSSGNSDLSHAHTIPADNGSTANAGGGAGHNNLQPYAVRHVIIKAL